MDPGPEMRRTSSETRGASGVDIHNIQALCDQISLAFCHGASDREIVDIFNIVIGSCDVGNEDSILRAVDAIGMVESQKKRLKICGIRLYNKLRALEPCCVDVFTIRLFAVRCMEAGSADPTSTLVCYVRTATKLLTLMRTGELRMNSTRALACFRRGFRLQSLDVALMSFKKMREERSKDLQEIDDLAASVFDGAIEFSRLEIDNHISIPESHPDYLTSCTAANFIAKMWVDAFSAIKMNVNSEFRRLARNCAQRAALTLFVARREPHCSLQLLNCLYETTLPTTPLGLNNLLVIAELQISTGDRGLAYATLDKLHAALEESSGMYCEDSQLEWSQIEKLDDSRPVDDHVEGESENFQFSSPAFKQFVSDMKEWLVRTRLLVAETKALRKSCERLHDNEESESLANAVCELISTFNTLCDRAKEGLLNITGLSRSFDGRRMIFHCLKAACHNICNELQYSEDVVCNTFLKMDTILGDVLDGRMKAELRVEVLYKLDVEDQLVCPLLEGLVQPEQKSTLNSSELQMIACFLWKRLQRQEKDNNLDGIVTSATYILEFIENDRELVASGHISIARSLLIKASNSVSQAPASDCLLQRCLFHTASGLEALADTEESELKSASTSLLKKRSDAKQNLVIHLKSLAFQAIMQMGNITLASENLIDLIFSHDASNKLLMKCIQDGVNGGIGSQVIQLLESKCQLDPTKTHYLVCTRLLQVGISPLNFVYREQGDNIQNNTQKPNRDTLYEVFDRVSTDIDESIKEAKKQSGKSSCSLDGFKWLQACTWALANTCIPSLFGDSADLLRGEFYFLCGTLSRFLYSINEADKEQHIYRMQLAFTASVACFSDYIITMVLDRRTIGREKTKTEAKDSFADIQNIPEFLPCLTKLKLLIDECASVEEQMNFQSTSHVWQIAGILLKSLLPIHETQAFSFLNTETITQRDEAKNKEANCTPHDTMAQDLAQKLDNSNLVQLGLFFRTLSLCEDRKHRNEDQDLSQAFIQQAMQCELAKPTRSGIVIGKLLALLIDLTRSAEEASRLVDQGLQIQKGDKFSGPIYFDENAREYLSSYAWNRGVELKRSESEEKESAENFFEKSAEFLEHCQYNHPDKEKSASLRKRIKEVTV